MSLKVVHDSTSSDERARIEILAMGRRAAELFDAWRLTPSQVKDPDGLTWHSNPARHTAYDAAWHAIERLAAALKVTPEQLGRCAGDRDGANCGAYCHKYGDGGNPLCPECLADVRARRAGSNLNEVYIC